MNHSELAYRESAGTTVRLLWDPATGQVSLEYADDRDGEQFMTTIPAARALDAFQHPNIYRPRSRRFARV